MPGLIERHRDLAKITISRVGEEVTLYEPQPGTENAYNKVSDTDRTFSQHSTGLGVRIFSSDNDRLEEAEAVGGMVDGERPIIALPYDSPASENWRVEFPDGNKYFLRVQIPTRTQLEFRTVKVNDDAP